MIYYFLSKGCHAYLTAMSDKQTLDLGSKKRKIDTHDSVNTQPRKKRCTYVNITGKILKDQMNRCHKKATNVVKLLSEVKKIIDDHQSGLITKPVPVELINVYKKLGSKTIDDIKHSTNSATLEELCRRLKNSIQKMKDA